jgi:uncharacterized membrane protein YhaH (DUF805 family)
MNFESVFIDPRGRIARAPFVGALIILLLVAALYFFLVGGLSGDWCLVVLIYPFIVLNARRLHDMGQTAWLTLAPAALLIATAYLHIYQAKSSYLMPVALAALVVSAGFALWGAIGKGEAEANRFGAPAAA